MRFLSVILAVVLVATCARTEWVRLDMKRLLGGKVLASGQSIWAKSLSHCIRFCNRRKKTCDGVVYHYNIEKCRLVDKCAAAQQVDNSSSAVYYSRRPQIMAPGYIYDPKSDSCIGLIYSKVNYSTADKICRQQKARLATIRWERANEIARSLLTRSRLKWGWINHENVPHETAVKPHGISGNDVLSQEVFAPKVTLWRNNSYRSCWSVNDEGHWGQFSCKNDTMVALCQVRHF